MASWPASLPQYMFLSFQIAEEPNVVVSQNSSGPPKIRRRGTLSRKLYRSPLELTKAQLDTFNTFFDTTLQSGSLQFDWTDPVSGSAQSYVFRDGKKPNFTNATPGDVADRRYVADIELERVI